MKTSLSASCLFLLCWCIFHSAKAQISAGGLPYSFSAEFQKKFGDEVPQAIRLPGIDLKKVQREDKQNPGTRFTTPVPVNYDLNNAGAWTELENGDRLWRIKFHSRGALALAVMYDRFFLPPGARLFMYSEDKEQVLGAYTFRNNKKGRRFWTGLIKGETAIVEYYEPRDRAGQGSLRIFRVDHAYQQENLDNSFAPLKSGFGDAAPCTPNINCPEWADWQDEKQGVCRVFMVVEEGIGYCSGSLLSNTSEDGTPLVLGAFHCQYGYTALWDMYRFDFNYEGEGCENPATEPGYQSILGSIYRAGHLDTDFILLELTTPLPAAYNAYLNGWSRLAVAPAAGTMIQHPMADIKKIAVDHDPATIWPVVINWDNNTSTPPLSHFRLKFDVGINELSASGSPLFNQNGKVVGQLHGGFSDCDDNTAYFGRLSESWDGGGTPDTRLKDWLDPTGSAPDTLKGMYYPATGPGTISGFVTTVEDEGICAVEITLLHEGGELSVESDVNGAFTFSDLLLGEAYGLTCSKDTNHINGVTTFDMIMISKHILGVEPLDSPYQILASDVNGSGSVSTLDLIVIRRAILRIQEAFENVPSWIFIPADFEFSDPSNPFADLIPAVYDITDFTGDIASLTFYGIKMGDVNGSASTD